MLSHAQCQHPPDSEKGGWREEKALGPPAFTPFGRKLSPPTPIAKLSLAPESGTDGQAVSSVQGECPHHGPNRESLGSDMAPRGSQPSRKRSFLSVCSLKEAKQIPACFLIGKTKQKRDTHEAMSACKAGGGRSPACHPSLQKHLHSGGGRGTKDQLCAVQASNPHHLQPGSSSSLTSPSPPASHSSCTGHHHVVTVVICRLAFSPQTKAQPDRGSRRAFCHLPNTTSALFSAPAPSPAGNMSRARTGQSSSSWERNSLEFDSKEQKKTQSKTGEKKEI